MPVTQDYKILTISLTPAQRDQVIHALNDRITSLWHLLPGATEEQTKTLADAAAICRAALAAVRA